MSKRDVPSLGPWNLSGGVGLGGKGRKGRKAERNTHLMNIFTGPILCKAPVAIDLVMHGVVLKCGLTGLDLGQGTVQTQGVPGAGSHHEGVLSHCAAAYVL